MVKFAIHMMCWNLSPHRSVGDVDDKGIETMSKAMKEVTTYTPVCRFGCIFKIFKVLLYVFISFNCFYWLLMVWICLNCYFNRYASNWTKFQVKLSILDPNRGIFGNWPMGSWGGGPLSESSRCRQELRPLPPPPKKKKYIYIYIYICFVLKPPNGSVV